MGRYHLLAAILVMASSPAAFAATNPLMQASTLPY